VSGELHALATLPLRKELPVPTGLARASLDNMRKFLALPGLELDQFIIYCEESGDVSTILDLTSALHARESASHLQLFYS
jgi:hypothetical protein